MHINEVERILRESVSGKDNRYEIKRYCDHTCCESDFVLLLDGLEYAYLKFDETGRMSRKAMGIHEEKMGTAYFYVVLNDTDAFIPTSLSCKVYHNTSNGIVAPIVRFPITKTDNISH